MRIAAAGAVLAAALPRVLPSLTMPPFLAGLLLLARALSASVTGVATDAETGAPVAGAVVAFTDLERAAVTDSAGRYTFHDVPSGPQHVQVRRIGYAPRVFHALVPREGVLRIDLSLRPEPLMMDPVDVSAPMAVRGVEEQGDAAFPDRGYSIAAVRQHPMLSEPDVHLAAGGGEVALRPEAPSGLHARGGRSDQVAHFLDGIPVLSPHHSAGTFSAWNPDVVGRVDLFTAVFPSWSPDGLSAVMAATTRTHAPRLQSRGSFSTTQARATIDGPLGSAGAGYVLGLRSTFPGLVTHKNEPTHLRGESGDWLAKIESPMLGGRGFVLGYGSDSDIDAASRVAAQDAPGAGGPRNRLSWESTSLGAGWAGAAGGATLRIRAWRAVLDAGAVWGDSASIELDARYREAGLAASIEKVGERGRTAAGVRIVHGESSYETRCEPCAAASLDLHAEEPAVAVTGEHRRTVGKAEVGAAASATRADGSVHLSSNIDLTWKPARALAISGIYARRHQLAQSLRNEESIAGTVFPVDLLSGAAPVARSDLGVLAAGLEPSAGIHIGLQLYARRLTGLVVANPGDFGPFTTAGVVEGSGVARGLSIEAAAAGARYGFVAAYALQHVRYSNGSGSYVPEHGAEHLLEAGANVFPSATMSIRLGIVSAFGRRTTAVFGPFEWEGCNLLDVGCEFAGSPDTRAGALGGTRLPAYVRVDAGLRKHWHLALFDRDLSLAVFATATNILARRNVMTIVVDPASGERRRVEMRPFSPLVAGLEWRF